MLGLTEARSAFQEVKPFLDRRVLKAVSLPDIVKHGVAAARLSSNAGIVDALRETLEACLDDRDDILVVRSIEDVAHEGHLLRLAQLGGGEAKTAGNALLVLFFANLLQPRGVFLNLREQRFRFDTMTDRLVFAPSQLNARFDEPFQKSLVELYSAFIADDDPRKLANARRLGLVPKRADDATERRVVDALERIFGDARQNDVPLSLDLARSSFRELAALVGELHLTLPAQWVFVGIAFGGLYGCLDSMRARYDVRASYEEAVRLLRRQRLS